MTQGETATGAEHFVVGIDLGGTKIYAALAAADGRVVADREVATASGDADSLLSQLADIVRELAEEGGVPLERIVATGIGGAGVPNDESASFDFAPNLGGVEELRLVDELTAVLGHRVVLENDVNVAALGELAEGVGTHCDNFVFVSVGTGIGMGIVIDGKLVRGHSGRAGEIGYLPFGTDPLDQANHHFGPLEEAVAGRTVGARYETRTGEKLGTRAVFKRAREGDVDALAAIDDEARWIATALVAVDAIINPAIFVLGGGIGSQNELLTSLTPWLERLGMSGLDVRHSELANRAPIIGAVRLALDSAHSSLGASGHENKRQLSKGFSR